jgi:hypothetical protein
VPIEENIRPDKEPKPARATAPCNLTLHAALLQRLTIRSSNVLVSMRDVSRITACGAAVFAANVTRSLRQANVSNVHFEASHAIGAIETNRILAGLLKPKSIPDLFDSDWQDPMSSASWETNKTIHFITIISNNISSTSNAKSRDAATAGLRRQIRSILKLGAGGSEENLILYTFTELARNTIDHTQEDAIMAFEVAKLDLRVKRFVYCELDEGFSLRLRKAMHITSNARSEREGITGLIHWAMKPGNSTKSDSPSNLGLGMTIIAESSRKLGFSLVMVDAESQVYLDDISRDTSHAGIRRRTTAIGWHPSFMYIGEREDA